jgi:hypothetical protein
MDWPQHDSAKNEKNKKMGKGEGWGGWVRVEGTPTDLLGNDFYVCKT